MPPRQAYNMLATQVDEKKMPAVNRGEDTPSENVQKGLFMRGTIKKITARTRSRSAPANLGRKRVRRRFVDQHFKIDKENLALLPGVPSHDNDLARDCHDFFNLIFLIPIVVLNIMNWDLDMLLSSKSRKGCEYAWTGDYFKEFWNTTIAYFIIDLLWVCVIPKCVKSPTTIIQHHIAALFYLMIPFFLPQYRWMMGFAMSVEINTWFLIARRVFNKQGFPPWTIDLPYLFSVKVKLISIFFYISWIVTRCIAYPYMMVLMYYEYFIYTKEAGSRFNVLGGAVCLHFIFCVLNVKWTFDLINSKLRQRKTYYVDKGL